ncbi:MAG: RdgB/HAM1 family non-canonical purine NTP pyrophosphatase [Oscillospiraceae bacterium]|jgi:XTP/dITP diphosphohydrolase|nr:RdgB/HAM1 family non-canonical purine NTP pyrophosphatase [Oscillospiraceae bacterium]
MKPFTILLATSNQGKLREIRELFTARAVCSPHDLGVFADAPETGETFAENAMQKARFYRDAAARVSTTPFLVIADDSGIAVAALGGFPGIHSKRWAGDHVTDAERCELLLEKMAGISDRRAEFVCAAAAILPDGQEIAVTGTLEGELLRALQGENGFGYDPIFFVPELGKTCAELTREEKNAVSHRGKAMRALRESILANG